MARAEGTPKTGGRKKGTPNKDSTNLQAALKGHGLDVVGRLTELLSVISPDRQVDVLLNLMPYLYPKRKSIEMTETLEAKDTKMVIELVESDDNHFSGLCHDQRKMNLARKTKNLMLIDAEFAKSVLNGFDEQHLVEMGFKRNI